MTLGQHVVGRASGSMIAGLSGAHSLSCSYLAVGPGRAAGGGLIHMFGTGCWLQGSDSQVPEA